MLRLVKAPERQGTPYLFLVAVAALAMELLTTAPAARAQASSDREAQRLFEEAETAYQRGDYDEAARVLRELHRMRPAPILLYNLGRSLERAGRSSEAVEAYERYLAEDEDPARERVVRERVVALRAGGPAARAVEGERDPGLLPERTAPPDRIAEPNGGRDEEARVLPPPRDLRLEDDVDADTVPTGGDAPSLLPWVVAGVGVAALAGGGVLGLLAVEKEKAAEEDETVHERAQEALDTARDLATAANVAWAIGGGLVLVGVIWGIVDLSSSGDDRDDDYALALDVGPSRAVAAYFGQF
jgi:tetratricopeptide (TPR) repeat protein